MLNSHTIPYQTRMQPYEQVLPSLHRKYNEPYTKPCHNRHQEHDAIHHLAFPRTVFYLRCLTLSSVMNVDQSRYCSADVSNLQVQRLCRPFSIPAAGSSIPIFLFPYCCQCCPLVQTPYTKSYTFVVPQITGPCCILQYDAVVVAFITWFTTITFPFCLRKETELILIH